MSMDIIEFIIFEKRVEITCINIVMLYSSEHCSLVGEERWFLCSWQVARAHGIQRCFAKWEMRTSACRPANFMMIH
jgi:hypothetical protein